MSSIFDPMAVLDLSTDEAAVKLPPLPIGDYTAVLGEVTARRWEGKVDTSKSGIAVVVPVTLEIPAETQAALGYSATYKMKDSIMLDLTESGSLDFAPGCNGQLRRYREACGVNVAGVPFSIRMLSGKAVLIRIKHDIWEGEPVNRIGGVTKMA